MTPLARAAVGRILEAVKYDIRIKSALVRAFIHAWARINLSSFH